MRLLPAALATIALTLSPAISFAQGAIADAKKRITERCQEIVDGVVARGVPGASAALVLPDGEVLTFVAGFASVEEKKALTPKDRLLSGSVGKTYVTAAVHLLVQRGKLDLDATAASYFEGEDIEWLARVPNATEITLRQCLQHTTGIPRYVYKPSFARHLSTEPDRTWTPEDLLSYVFDDEPLFAAGEGWSYADTNYVVAGIVIEKVTGRTFYELVQKELLQPLELADTVPSNSRDVPGIVQGYVVLGRGLGLGERTLEDGRFTFNPQFEWCGGGYANTPSDLARWAGLLYGGKAFEGDYLTTLLDGTDAAALGPGLQYGLGAMLCDTDAGSFVGHDGFMPGYLTTMGYFPERKMSAALQLNGDDSRKLAGPTRGLLVEMVEIASKELGSIDR